MEDIDRLIVIEQVRRLRASYFYALDLKDWSLMASLFSDDAVYDVRLEAAFAQGLDPTKLPSREVSLAANDPAITIGGQAIADLIESACGDWITVHHGHEPIIDVLGPNYASAIWPMFDYIDDGTNAMKGYGHYHEKYRKGVEGWRITDVILTRLRSDGTHPWSVKVST